MALREEFEKTGNFLFRWRSYLPLLILPILLIALRKSEYLETMVGGIWELVCVALSFMGLVIRCIVVGYAPKRTSGRNTKRQQAETLNTTGMYSLLRHPLYLGNFFIFLGIVMFTQAIWFILFSITVFWLYYERIMFAEEEFLRKKFGDIYLKWAEKILAFIPKFKYWQQPSLPFSFRNVLKKEYSGFFGIIASFTFLEIIRDIFVEGKLELDLVWTILFIIGLIIYLTLRILKKKTKILNVERR